MKVKCCLNQSGNMQMPILIIFVETLVEFPNLIIHSKTRRVLTSTPKTVAAEWRNEDTLCCLATSANNNRELIQYRTSTGTYSPDWTYIFLCGSLYFILLSPGANGIEWKSLLEKKLNKDFDWDKIFKAALGKDETDTLDQVCFLSVFCSVYNKTYYIAGKITSFWLAKYFDECKLEKKSNLVKSSIHDRCK